MKIHFICSGNTNRSRMAEAYLNSKKIPWLTATSSGIHADNNLNGPISDYAKKALEEDGLLIYAKKSWQKTTKEILSKVDIAVFMEQKYFDFVKNELNYVPPHYVIWNVNDVPTDLNGDSEMVKQEKTLADENIFNIIKKQVDQLIIDLK